MSLTRYLKAYLSTVYMTMPLAVALVTSVIGLIGLFMGWWLNNFSQWYHSRGREAIVGPNPPLQFHPTLGIFFFLLFFID